MKKLLPGPLDFIVNYPLGAYALGMFTPEAKNVAAYVVTPKSASLYVAPKEGGPGAYAENVSGVEGAVDFEMLDPGTSDIDSFVQPGQYNEKVVKRFGLRKHGGVVLLLDHPKLYINLHSLHAAEVTIDKVYEELQNAPASFFPGWQGGEGYYWTAMTEAMGVANPNARAAALGQVFFAGMPVSYVDFICSWAKHSRQLLKSIIPFPLAVAGWAKDAIQEDKYFHLLVPTGGALCFFTYNNGKYTNYNAPKNDNYAVGDLAGVIDEDYSNTPESANGPVYVWPTVGVDTEKIMSGLRQAGVRQAGLVALSDSNGMPIAPTASLCEWALHKTIDGFPMGAGAPEAIELSHRVD